MNKKVEEFYSGQNYSSVTPLQEMAVDFGILQKEICNLPKGWYELSYLELEMRLEFFLKFWQQVLPFHAKLFATLASFFYQLEDVFFFVVEKNKQKRVDCIYSTKDGSLFIGAPPANLQTIQSLNDEFKGTLPKDYLSFLQIHDGFCKSSDTGLIKTKDLLAKYAMISNQVTELACMHIEKGDLIPFYECFGLHSFQCFFKKWHPTSEMGNIYYSQIEKSVSSYNDPQSTLAFETFSDWLAFYIEIVE